MNNSRDCISGTVIVYALLGICIGLFFQLQYLGAPLTDLHYFRQAQTANSIYWMLKEGYHVIYPQPIFGSPWSVPMEFPVYQTIIYTFAKTFQNDSIEWIGRIVNLSFFYFALWILFRLARKLELSSRTAWIFVYLVVISPVYVFWTRTVMIESGAFCFGALFCYLGIVYTKGRSNPGVLLLFLLVSMVAALTKVTTYLVFLLFLFVYVVSSGKQRKILCKKNLILAIVILISLAVFKLWTWQTDQVKEANFLAEGLTAENLEIWNFGTIEQRLEIGSYQRVIKYILINTTVYLPFLIGTPLLLLMKRVRAETDWRLFGVSVLAFIGSFLVFFNLYYTHLYYWYANSAFLAFATAILLSKLLDVLRGSFWVHLLCIGIGVLSLSGYYHFYFEKQSDSAQLGAEILSVGDFLNQNTNDNDVVYMGMETWSPIYAYMAKRRAIIVKNMHESVNSKRMEQLLEASARGTGGVGAALFQGKFVESREPAVILEKRAILDRFGMDENFTLIGSCEVYLKLSDITNESQ